MSASVPAVLPNRRTAGRAAAYPVGALALYCFFVVILYSRLLLHSPGAAYVGGGSSPARADPTAFMWFLAWTPYALSHHLNPLVTDWIFADSGANLAWNTAVPFVGLVMSPVTRAAGPVFSYNIAMMLGMVASAWCGYYAAVRILRCAPSAAILAGALYGFSPFMMAHADGHLHLEIAFAPPLLMLVLHDVFVTQQRPAWINGVGLAALAFVQYFISAEVLAIVGLLALVGACVLIGARRHTVTLASAGYAARSLLVGAVVSLAVLSYPLYLMAYGPWQPHHPIHGSTGVYVADLLSFVVPTPAQAISAVWLHPLRSNFSGNVGEWDTYLGAPMIALLGILAYAKRSDCRIRFLLVMMLVTGIFSLGPSLHIAGRVFEQIPLPWHLLERLPWFRDIFATRLGLIVYLLVGLALAIYVSDESVSRTGRCVRWAACLAALAFLMPAAPLPYPVTTANVPEFFRLPSLQAQVDSPALIVPLSGDVPPESAAMLWQAEAAFTFKMVEGDAFGGGSGPWPHPTPLSNALIAIEASGQAPVESPALRARIISVLRRQRVQTVLVGPSLHEHEVVNFLANVLGRSPDALGGVFVWRRIGGPIASEAPRP